MDYLSMTYEALLLPHANPIPGENVYGDIDLMTNITPKLITYPTGLTGHISGPAVPCRQTSLSDIDAQALFQIQPASIPYGESLTSLDVGTNKSVSGTSELQLGQGDKARTPHKELPSQSLPQKCNSSTSATPASSAHISPLTSPPSPMLQLKNNTHNMAEKRYRSNINNNLISLRNAVPSLRIMVHHQKQLAGEIIDEETEDLDGLVAAKKMNKATVLTKATEYIWHLERKNISLSQENDCLKSRIASLEIAICNELYPIH